MNNVRNFHIRHGYVVKVEGVDSQAGCMVDFPYNLFIPAPAIRRIYLLHTDPCVIEIYESFLNGETASRAINALITNMRLLVIQDVFLTAHNRGMSKELIVTGGSKTFFKMLEIPQTENERKLETSLCLQFRSLLEGNVVSSDIDGYDQILECFENGGL